MNNIDSPMKMLQFLRISNIYDNKETAIEALKNITHSAVGKQLEDGTPILARFGSQDRPMTLMGILFKQGNDAFITIVEGRDDLYSLINDLYGITTDLNDQTSDIRGHIVTINRNIAELRLVDAELQEQINLIAAKQMVVASNPENDYISISSSTVGDITTYTINESHELDMGTW